MTKLDFFRAPGSSPLRSSLVELLEGEKQKGKENSVEAIRFPSYCELKSDASSLEHNALLQAGVPSFSDGADRASSTLTV